MKKKDKKLEWETKKIPLSSVKEFEHNPRQLSKKQYQDLKKSLQKFDYVEVAAVDYDNTLIAGHQRLRVLRELKGDDIEIDVRVPNRKLTEKEFKEYLVRSNKNTGEWDYDILANTYEIQELIEYGFSEEELQVNDTEYMQDEYSEDFTLKDGEKQNIQQLTFILCDEQAELIKNKIKEFKKTDKFKFIETFGNENTNGNALYGLLV
jgi:ParB-like chromosome segregation protein Spo0J